VTDINAETNAETWVSSSHRPMGFPEFVVVIASIMALNPLAMDMMLPALPHIASAFHITVANRPQAVLSTFLIGFGIGQFVMGPLSDRFGRRAVLIDGMALYCIASVVAIMASSFETLLLARVLQGLGTSATRVIATSIVRDCYAGRRMASVMSLAMMVFIAVPVIAPSIGQAVMLLTQWRGIFIVLMLYGVLALIWSALRMPETLPVSERKSLAIRDVLGAFRQTVTNRQTLGYALAAGGVQGSLFAFVFSSQQVFTEIYGLGRYFPLAFAAIAIGVAVAGFSQCPFRRPAWHAGDFAWRAARLRGGGGDHAHGGEAAHAAAAAVHGVGGTDDVRVRADVRQFHFACDGAAGPYRGHRFVALRVDHDAARDWHRHRDRPGL
jgi:DHA1 family bicyclomycin/chloramphenicol resistance-like MFS transporter